MILSEKNVRLSVMILYWFQQKAQMSKPYYAKIWEDFLDILKFRASLGDTSMDVFRGNLKSFSKIHGKEMPEYIDKLVNNSEFNANTILTSVTIMIKLKDQNIDSEIKSMVKFSKFSETELREFFAEILKVISKEKKAA